MKQRYLETGEIVGTHGVRGEMRLYPWCDSPDFLSGIKRLYLDKEGKAVLDVVSARVHGTLVLIKVKGVDDIPAAERLRGKTVYLDRKDARIEKGAYFIQDLIGCAVIDADDGHCYGTVCDVSKTGANDVWHIKQESREVLIPAIPDVVIDVDIDREKVVIRAMKGLFDDED